MGRAQLCAALLGFNLGDRVRLLQLWLATLLQLPAGNMIWCGQLLDSQSFLALVLDENHEISETGFEITNLCNQLSSRCDFAGTSAKSV